MLQYITVHCIEPVLVLDAVPWLLVVLIYPRPAVTWAWHSVNWKPTTPTTTALMSRAPFARPPWQSRQPCCQGFGMT